MVFTYYFCRYPRKVTKKMSKKKVQRRSAIKPFLKVSKLVYRDRQQE